MALIYITGVAGTGKSTICQLLRSKGYLAYDADVDGVMGWRHIATKTPVYGPDHDNYLSAEWYRDYEWSIGRGRVTEIAEEAKTQTVFLCGTSANDSDIHDLLSKVVFLSIDEDTVRHRLATRDTNDWGKKPEDVAHILNWIKPLEEYHKTFGAIMLDATLPLDHLVESIVGYAAY